MKSGFVTLIGRPNTGKSTLLNSIIGEKVAIISPKPQTTRNLIQGIYTTDETQIVFVDTPSIHKPIDKLGSALNDQAYYSYQQNYGWGHQTAASALSKLHYRQTVRRISQ